VRRLFKSVRDEIRYEVGGILLLAFVIFLLTSLLTDKAGALGELASQGMRLAFGASAALMTWLLGLVGVALLIWRGKFLTPPRAVGLVILFLLLPSLFHLSIPPGLEFENAKRGLGGGHLGAFVAWGLLEGLGPWGRGVAITAMGLVAILLVTDRSFLDLLRLFGRLLRSLASLLRIALARLVASKPTVSEEEMAGTEAPVTEVQKGEREPTPSERKPTEPVDEHAGEDPEILPQYRHLSPDLKRRYELPPVSLLARSRSSQRGLTSREIKDRAAALEQTLRNFGVDTKVVDVSVGPAVTRYELEPGPGVKVSRIVALANDIALNLAAPHVRIEAPVPGKAVVGVEVPNPATQLVPLRDLVESREFRQSKSPTTVALGKDISGRPVITSLEQTLHLLIAGATGSGKSVCLQSIILSLLFRAHPDQVKLLLVDPKVVELSAFNRVPHLLAPVVTDPRQAAGALRWVVGEMERRYEAFATLGAKDINRYNSQVLKGREGDESLEPLPFIVVIVDELADLMMVAPAEVEDAIHRLAQMARAAGIHLVLATQRPSVDVITGVIKANIPSRIAFAVSSQADSRTILDVGGAEKLLGRGDMLFLPVGANKPMRLQGAYVSESDVEAVVDFTAKQTEPKFEEDVITEGPADDDQGLGQEDELLPEAVKVVFEHGQASISLLQRKLRIGYTRAGRLIDAMEERGFVGPFEGSKAREVLITYDEYRRLFGDSTDSR